MSVAALSRNSGGPSRDTADLSRQETAYCVLWGIAAASLRDQLILAGGKGFGETLAPQQAFCEILAD